MRTAMDLITAERERQINVEGWTDEHDDQHCNGELLDAAMCYYLHAVEMAVYRTKRLAGVGGTTCPHCGQPIGQRLVEDGPSEPVGWPWEPKWWKPKGKQRDLERAGALLLAEKDRLTRAGLPSGHVDHKLRLVAAALTQELANAS